MFRPHHWHDQAVHALDRDVAEDKIVEIVIAAVAAGRLPKPLIIEFGRGMQREEAITRQTSEPRKILELRYSRDPESSG